MDDVLEGGGMSERERERERETFTNSRKLTKVGGSE